MMNDVLKQNQSSLESVTIFDKFVYCLKYVAIDIVIIQGTSIEKYINSNWDSKFGNCVNPNISMDMAME